MFNFLQKSFKNTVYFRIQPEWLSALHVESGKEYADIPIVAIEKRKDIRKIIAIGREALTRKDRPDITIMNGFNHPRTLISDFAVAEKTLQYFLWKQLFSKSILRPSPTMIIHPLKIFEGGLTPIEVRILYELGLGCYARKVYIWQGPELSHKELTELRFSQPTGELLNPENTYLRSRKNLSN